MPDKTTPPDMESDVVNEIIANANGNSPKLSLEALILLINAERLKQLHNKTHNEFTELRKRQGQVKSLHDLLKRINTNTTDVGEFDCSSNSDIQDLLKQAKEIGVDVEDGKFKYSKDERDRLVENVRMTIEDLNVMNDMQLQTVNRLTNERYESYQLVRSIIKPLHEAKMQISRNISK